MKLTIKIINNEKKEKCLQFEFSINNNIDKIFEVSFTDETTDNISKIFEYILNFLYENKGNENIVVEEFENKDNIQDQEIVKSYCKLLEKEIESSKRSIQEMFID